eukprot:8658022-Prorocentrum_lima.AAC.1
MVGATSMEGSSEASKTDEGGNQHMLMLDSGAQENVAPRNFGAEGNDTAPRVMLRDVAGRP